ncbi:hypothetical protein CHUAL_013525 [Chamberlinius hualienensis]
MAAKKVRDGYELVPPDGGWGWIVLMGCVLAGLMIAVPIPALGLMFQDILTDMDTTTSTASWIPAISVTTAQLIAPFNAILMDTYSPRVSAICGGLCVSLGLIFSYFANTIEVLFITFGIFTGAGLGITTNASLVILSQYFRKRFGIATGITMASYSSGRLIFAPVMQYLLEIYDYRGVLLILGGMNLNVVVGALLFQPVSRHLIEQRIQSSIKKSKENNSKSLSTPNDSEAANTLISTQNSSTVAAEKLNNYANKSSDQMTGCCNKGPLKSLKFSQLKQPIFYIILISGCLNNVCSIYFGVFLPSLAHENGLQPMEAAIILSARSGAEIFGRLTAPWIQHHFQIKLLPLYIGLTIAQGISFIIMVFTYSLPGMMSVTIITGIINGSHTGLAMLLVVTCVKPQNLNAVMSLSQFVQGFLYLPSGPLIGLVSDSVGTFDICFYVIAALQFLIAVAWMLKPLAMKYSTY